MTVSKASVVVATRVQAVNDGKVLGASFVQLIPGLHIGASLVKAASHFEAAIVGPDVHDPLGLKIFVTDKHGKVNREAFQAVEIGLGIANVAGALFYPASGILGILEFATCFAKHKLPWEP